MVGKRKKRKQPPPAPKGIRPFDTLDKGGAPIIYTIEFIENEALELLKWMGNETHDGIFFTEFALKRGYSRQRFSEWAEKSKRFSDVLKIAKEWQEHKLTKGALTKEYEAGFAKFVMPRVCGEQWKDIKNLNVTSTGPVAPWIAEADGTTKDLMNES